MTGSGVIRHWTGILKYINYWPIFSISIDVIAPITDSVAADVLEKLSDVAIELAGIGSATQHDLSGRMLQKLIVDRKFLATFYTLPSSAALLAEMSVERLNIDWSDPDNADSMLIGDFACGTGALLNAAYQSVLSRYRRRGINDRELHPKMMEKTLVGADIMPVATHLTTSVLSSAHPRVPFKETQIWTLPYGVQKDSPEHRALGALEFMNKSLQLDMFADSGKRIRGVSGPQGKDVKIPHNGFDLVIMNPPFTRATNSDQATEATPIPSLAGMSTSIEDQKAMANKLKGLCEPGMAGHGNAGLASYFIDIADVKLKEGGVLALVLPFTFVQGKSWEKARALIEKRYRDIVLISISSTEGVDRAFSHDTAMAEAVIIATRGKPDGQPMRYINLYRRPQSIIEAYALSRTIKQVPSSDFAIPLCVGDTARIGYLVQGSFSDGGCASVRDIDLTQCAIGLTRGKLLLPRSTESLPLPVTSLGNLGERGLLHRDISGEGAHGKPPRGPFDESELSDGEVPSWPFLWNHDAKRETRLIVEPDKQGVVRPGCGQRAKEVWYKTSSRLHINLDFRLTSQPLTACLTKSPTIGGTAWPNFLCMDENRVRRDDWEIPIVLWFNTTLGLISFWWHGTTQHPGRSRITITKIPGLCVIDTRKLSDDQLSKAKSIFDHFKDRKFDPANQVHIDKTREELDRAVLVDLLEMRDDALGTLQLLREKFCAEPTVHGERHKKD